MKGLCLFETLKCNTHLFYVVVGGGFVNIYSKYNNQQNQALQKEINYFFFLRIGFDEAFAWGERLRFLNQAFNFGNSS